MATLLTTAKREKQLKCSLMDEHTQRGPSTPRNTPRPYKEGRADTCYQRDGPRGHDAEQNKPVKDKYHDLIHTWNLRKQNEHKKRETNGLLNREQTGGYQREDGRGNG